MTKRILTALNAHPKVRIVGHPTARLLNSRDSIQADWPTIFAACLQHDIALEINGSPERMDLPDQLVFEARKMGCMFVIDTDSHAHEALANMEYGVSVARRGWCEARDILNTKSSEAFHQWLMK